MENPMKITNKRYLFAIAALVFNGVAWSSPTTLGPLNPGTANMSIAKMGHAGFPPPTLSPAPHEAALFTPIGESKRLRFIASGNLASSSGHAGVFVLINELSFSEFGNGKKGAGFFLYSGSFPP